MKKKKMRKNWQLGFLGLLSLIVIPQYKTNGPIGLSWILWIVWLVYFIPTRK